MSIYESDRRFEVMQWGVGHRGLLLRSNPTSDRVNRIEVLFKPAYAACIGSLLEGLRIARGDAAEQGGAVEAVIGRPLKEWENVFTVEAGMCTGWVVGGSVSGREDDNTYEAPTMFDGWAPRPGVRELFTTHDDERP